MKLFDNAVEWYQVDSRNTATWHVSLPHTPPSTGCLQNANAVKFRAVQMSRDIPKHSCWNCRKQYRLYLRGLLRDPRVRPRQPEVTVVAS
jgi:hypothetical protein